MTTLSTPLDQLPIDCILLIIDWLTLPAISNLSLTAKTFHTLTRTNAGRIYASLVSHSLPRPLKLCYDSAKGELPFRRDDILVESRLFAKARAATATGKNGKLNKSWADGRGGEGEWMGEGGWNAALYHFLRRRERLVVTGEKSAVVERLAGDPRAARHLLENGVRMGTVDPDDPGVMAVCGGHVPLSRSSSTGSGISVEGVAPAHGHSATSSTISPPPAASSAPPLNPSKPPTHLTPILQTESLRANLLLHSAVETLRLFGCAATKASKSSPGHSFIACKYVPWILAELHTAELRVVMWAVLNLGGLSFTEPSRRWRHDAMGFEVADFERVYLRPFLKKALADRGDFWDEV
ncbi:uncharacterized protein EV422DRAFT_522353 [Fimicolochytrium jonesii]|uniref:uncharacterized protein n=1 Tax=Fimicolochytrium jonesii TaxID=1396493 RepID=UPI0022FE5633|nr:uncharacterized protein EV422DRAFT_522353 [Fimicolochytrium jonesii]KAI8823785.1 hypothetical protein EV422DRAFT_522353 [Fimicolochytrium jonesii]